jgi:enoyl-CoA hydratase
MQHFSRSMARYMYFTSRRIPAAELHRLGVITNVLPPDQLMAEAKAIAAEIAAKSPTAVRAVKRAFNVVEEMPTRDAYRYEQTITVDLSKSDDTKEAQAAFVEKRKPNFKGG